MSRYFDAAVHPQSSAVGLRAPHAEWSSSSMRDEATVDCDHPLANHLPLFGLSCDRSDSLVTCVRELFENALDAIITRTAMDECATPTNSTVAPSQSCISVSLQPLDVVGKLWRVRVQDNGHGFDEAGLSRVSDLFNSSKGNRRTAPTNDDHNPSLDDLNGSSTGVFGVGLKAVMIWAHLSAPSDFVEICTKTELVSHMSQLSVRLVNAAASHNTAATGVGEGEFMLEPDRHIGRHEHSSGGSAGSRISATLQGGVEALPRIRRYLEAAQGLLVPCAIRLHVDLADELP
jgi:hypothetical protein